MGSLSGPYRRGLYTAGTRIRWDDLSSWLLGCKRLWARICRGGRGHSEALTRHAFALAGELEHVATASRDQLDQLLHVLDRCPSDAAAAKATILGAANVRDRLLRRLDGEPEEGERRRWIVMVLHRNGCSALDVVPTVLPQRSAELALARHRQADAHRVVVLVGDCDRPQFLALALGSVLEPFHRDLRLTVPWFQAWRPQVATAYLAIIDELVRSGEPLGTTHDLWPALDGYVARPRPRREGAHV